ncbi:hypothetical protein QTG54_004317 [Skeletonema marinoi]|uniref:Uncharacterized protein n=1 Tax=Skeletonema marinoi TaxID=267567 RepID=A0AAD8YEH0_9STRA|nr:hypothetical protein QTG54_004317 [Skeletonema marinoi]
MKVFSYTNQSSLQEAVNLRLQFTSWKHRGDIMLKMANYVSKDAGMPYIPWIYIVWLECIPIEA